MPNKQQPQNNADDISIPIIFNLNKGVKELKEAINTGLENVSNAVIDGTESKKDIEGDVYVLNSEEISQPIVDKLSENIKAVESLVEAHRANQEMMSSHHEEKKAKKDYDPEIVSALLDLQDSIYELKQVATEGNKIALDKEVPKFKQEKLYIEELADLSNKVGELISVIRSKEGPDFSRIEKLLDDIKKKDLNVVVSGGGTDNRGIIDAINNLQLGGIPANKATDAYSYQALGQTATYLYVYKEDGTGNWYIQRFLLSTMVADYAKGTGGYLTVFGGATSDPIGSLTWGTYDQIFNNVGAESLNFDVLGNLKVNIQSPIESNGAVPVNVQDQHSTIVDVFMCEDLGAVTLASDATIDTYTATFTAGHGIVVGNMLCFKEGTQFMQATVLNVATNVITLDMPFDYSYTTAATINRSNNNMAVDGSVTRKIFKVTPVGTTNKFDVTRLSFHIEDNVAMDDSKFGGITALTRGIVLRKKDGTYKNIFNAKSNADFKHHCQNSQYDDRAGGTGNYSFYSEKVFAGQANMGVTVRLDYAAGDEIQVIIQDNLTALVEFHCVVEGHVVTD